MPKVTFLPLNKTVEAEVGQTLLEVSEDHDIGLEHACGGVCACSTCHVIVQDGTDNNLEPQDDEEIDTMDKLCPTQTVHSRLGCQARVRGDVTVQIFNWPPREM
ncbi:MAG TPA: 2Fe-2S iron-sulfur cluster-binding protein [Candidatus Sumerlaeota bacterium]|nr:2Fe-2S iron-sulfur cluster-binding protein [Candidatus Sumerlaeota bacterium]HNM45896.1 2Fe-2S iron-sulfur cluster-binding protein [Candidatus Sumerlaeota bacterium]